ncbi:MAG: hypothetical protein M3063_08850 [Actinomycetota bacterium]|nr:hypothetical protein [Actinomycetota bacterium]
MSGRRGEAIRHRQGRMLPATDMGTGTVVGCCQLERHPHAVSFVVLAKDLAP